MSDQTGGRGSVSAGADTGPSPEITSQPAGPALALRAVRKVYGATVAVDNLTLELRPGTVHAVVGENGAGKSTAAQIAAGIVEATSGAVEVDGAPVGLSSARQAEALGIAFLPQELQLYEPLSVAENLHVGRARPRDRRRLISGREMTRRATAQLDRLGIEIDPAQRVAELSHASRQLVAITRMLLLDARVLIMDEPTAALDEWEVQRLLGVVSVLRSAGVAVMYVSHRLPEILQIADVITVMRDGKAVASGPRRDFDEHSLAASMLGRALARMERRARQQHGDVVFAARGLSRAGVFEEVSLEVRAGEIVGLAGLIGSGRSEFAQAVFGRDRPTGGLVEIGGAPVRIKNVRHAIQLGLGYVPEERQSQGLFLPLSGVGNVAMAALHQLQHLGLLSMRREEAYGSQALAPLSIKGDVTEPVNRFSGGTQQKVLLGKWLALRPRVLILDEPTRGIDVGTRFEIYQIIERLTDAGVGVLLISSDIQEILLLSDRVAVMRAGRLVAEFTGDEVTEMNIGAAALGAAAVHGEPR